MKPSIGRIVTYFMGDLEAKGNHTWPSGPNGTRKHPAIITRVWSDDCVNLQVFFDCGAVEMRSSALRIPELPDGVEMNPANSGWTWPVHT